MILKNIIQILRKNIRDHDRYHHQGGKHDGDPQNDHAREQNNEHREISRAINHRKHQRKQSIDREIRE